MDFSEFENLKKTAGAPWDGVKLLGHNQTQFLNALKPTLALQEQMNTYAELFRQRNLHAHVRSPFQELTDSVQKSMENLGQGVLKELQESLTSKIRLPLLELAQNLPSMKVLGELRPLWTHGQGSLTWAIQEFVEKIQHTRGVDVRPVLSLGWHLAPCMAYSDLFEALECPTDEEKDAFLSQVVRDYLDELIPEVFTTLSDRAERFGGEAAVGHRKRHLTAAFEAHRAGQYALSIPALFAQVEGLTLTGLGEPLDGNGFFFSSKPEDREKGLEPLVRAAGDFKALEAPLLGPSVYGAPIREYLAGDRRCPNRHAVLHGRDLEFDTETNGLKIITLVGYAVWLISEVDQEAIKGQGPEEKP